MAYSVNRRTFLSTFAASGLAGCTAPGKLSLSKPGVEKVNTELHPLEYEYWPTTGRSRTYYSASELNDLPRLQTYQDTPGATHAVKTARQLNRVAQSIRYTDAPEYETAADRLTKAFVETASEVDGALFFPYEFEFHLHGIEDEHMPNPWYSGMAQGLALAAFARLQQFTGQDRYADIAEQTYQSLTQARPTAFNRPWVTTVDNDGYYWIEEYPVHPAAHTLNGKIFAIYGLYEYWCITGRDDVEATIQKALATVLAHLPEFREEDGISHYCLKHYDIQSAKYHHIHIDQLTQLHQITGDERFREWAERLRTDFWKPDKQ